MAIRTRGTSLQIDVTHRVSPGAKPQRHREAFVGSMKEAKERELEIKLCLQRGDPIPALGDAKGTVLTVKQALYDAHALFWVYTMGQSMDAARKRKDDRDWQKRMEFHLKHQVSKRFKPKPKRTSLISR